MDQKSADSLAYQYMDEKQKLTVILKVLKHSDPLDEREVLAEIIKLIDKAAIVAFGSINHNQWSLTLSDSEAVNGLLEVNVIMIGNKRMSIQKAVEKITIGKIHNLPFQVPDIHIKVILMKYGTVVSIQRVLSTEPGFERMFTNTRKFQIKLKNGVTQAMLPNVININGMIGLLTVLGQRFTNIKNQPVSSSRKRSFPIVCVRSYGLDDLDTVPKLEPESESSDVEDDTIHSIPKVNDRKRRALNPVVSSSVTNLADYFPTDISSSENEEGDLPVLIEPPLNGSSNQDQNAVNLGASCSTEVLEDHQYIPIENVRSLSLLWPVETVAERALDVVHLDYPSSAETVVKIN